MTTAAIDIGSNSVRLLVSADGADVERLSVVTGLGKGVAASGRLTGAAIARTLDVLTDFRHRLESAGATRVVAVATAAARMAGNTSEFLDAAEEALGLRPQVISGDTEATLSFLGATADLGSGGWMVVDIGGASTEFVAAPGEGISLDIGSVRLTDRMLVTSPVSPGTIAAARRHVLEMMGEVLPTELPVVGVAGTWTSLAGLKTGSDGAVHRERLTDADLSALVSRLAALNIDEIAQLPGLDPARAPVILGGAIVASASLEVLGADSALVSVHDLLDALVREPLV